MTAYTKWRLVFWLLVALLVAGTIFAALEIYAELRPAACCGSVVCSAQRHHESRLSPERSGK